MKGYGRQIRAAMILSLCAVGGLLAGGGEGAKGSPGSPTCRGEAQPRRSTGTPRRTSTAHAKPPLSLAAEYGFVFLKAYQHVFGRFIRSDCPMEPSCSHYSQEALATHGAVKGVILTADRLLHETDEAPLVPKRWIPGRGHCALDPVSHNLPPKASPK